MLNNSKIIRAWSLYDWSNSVYSLVISSTIFPIFFSSITTEENFTIRKKIEFLGFNFEPDAIYSYSLTLSFILVVLLSPILSSIADTLKIKKKFLIFFCILGSFSCMGMYFFRTFEDVYILLILSILSSFGFWGSLVFYNSYLPDIASKDKQDEISAKGYVFGYVGSVILMIICLICLMKFNLSPNFCFLITGLWWFIFAQYTFFVLPKDKKIEYNNENFLTKSLNELKFVQNQLFSDYQLKIFLPAFFFYSVGMQTIFLMAVMFGKSEIQLASDKLILTILLLQIEAIVGAFLFSRFSKIYGNKNVLIVGVIFWIIACIGGFLIDKNHQDKELHFYLLAGLVGLVMGGIQSLSRSTYSKMLPNTTDTTTYFSFFDIVEKLAIVLGTLVYGFIIDWTGSMRFSILSMGIFFIFGLIFLLKLKKVK